MTDLYFPKSKISVKVEKLKFLACLEVCICKCRPVNNSKSQIEVRIRKCGPVNNSKTFLASLPYYASNNLCPITHYRIPIYLITMVNANLILQNWRCNLNLQPMEDVHIAALLYLENYNFGNWTFGNWTFGN